MHKKAHQRRNSSFRQAVGSVRRVTHDHADLQRPKPEPVPKQSMAEARRVLAEMTEGDLDPADLETGEELLYCAPGLQTRQFRKLRRGQFAVEAELDLHGMTAEDAREAVAAFVSRARDSHRHCVRIIHGKGRRSHGGRPVLKTRRHRWLRQRAEVLAFCSARPVDGGTGAVYVLLKRRR